MQHEAGCRSMQEVAFMQHHFAHSAIKSHALTHTAMQQQWQGCSNTYYHTLECMHTQQQ